MHYRGRKLAAIALTALAGASMLALSASQPQAQYKITVNKERLLARQNRSTGVKPILELNMRHPLVQALARATADGRADDLADLSATGERNSIARRTSLRRKNLFS